jgi:hypothetical protein
MRLTNFHHNLLVRVKTLIALKMSGSCPQNVVAYFPKARIVESQQPAVTRQRPISSNRGMVFSAKSVLMAAHATVEYIRP